MQDRTVIRLRKAHEARSYRKRKRAKEEKKDAIIKQQALDIDVLKKQVARVLVEKDAIASQLGLFEDTVQQLLLQAVERDNQLEEVRKQILKSFQCLSPPP